MKHPYQNLWSRIAFCVERNGAAEVVLIPLRMLASPLLVPLLPQHGFQYEGRSLAPFYHRYNVTWANERMLEIPIARSFLEGIASDQVLEIGNVLSHYTPVHHRILDKFEQAPGVINEDVLTWKPGRTFERILSISTFEHIGFDDEDKDPTGQRILEALRRTRGYLAPSGRLMITAAAGYNPAFDGLVRGNRFGADRCQLYHRASRFVWESCSEDRYLGTRYNAPYAFGNALVVAEFGPLNGTVA